MAEHQELLDALRGDEMLMAKGMKGVHRPTGGWKEHTWYLCLCAFSSTNPVHEILTCVGFVGNDGEPTSYSRVVSVIGGDSTHSIQNMYYLQPIRELYTQDELTGKN